MQIHLAQQLLVIGQVQGVGFRPHVYRLATALGLVGWVKNLAGQVEIRIQGQASALQTFTAQLITQAPPLAKPQIVACTPCVVEESLTTFTINASEVQSATHIHLPPDYFTCDDCLAELHNPQDRRYRYPFINCTQCGPRYTLIHRLPYDRPNTSMANFPLCPQCLAEYQQPAERRFHAQPLACPNCGPQLTFKQGDEIIKETALALQASVQALRDGKIIAVKGIGGYHLLCDASNDAVVQRLRARKPRPAKPLAIMLPIFLLQNASLASKQLALAQFGMQATEREVILLYDPMRPIVLIRKISDNHSLASSLLQIDDKHKPNHVPSLSKYLAPGLTEIGVMLPYSPLHHLLSEDFGAPLVATSANLSGEPVLTDNEEVEQRLAHLADGFLHHNRPILHPADDCVFKTIAGKLRPLRLGRGKAPIEMTLPITLPYPLLAVGAHLKNTVALAWDKRVVISPHIGDLGAPRSVAIFEQIINKLQQLYQVQAKKIICDAHPNYANSRWAKRHRLPIIPVYHHHAHASALVGELAENNEQPWLIFTWDGVGFGEDGTLWGGEALYGHPGRWRRVATMRPFSLLGGEKAARELWRSALALCWETDITWHSFNSSLHTQSSLAQEGFATDDSFLINRDDGEFYNNINLLRQAWQRRFNSPSTSAVGRLFDAATALLGILHTASFEGQGPMLLEAACTACATIIDLPLQKNSLNVWQTDWAPLLPYLLDSTITVADRATGFHNSIAHALVTQAQQLRREYLVNQIGLSGGVFQNRYLTEMVFQLLQKEGFTVYSPQHLPCNDAAISFGQIIEIAAKIGESS